MCRQDTHTQCTYSEVQSLHKRGTHRTRLAGELQRHLCAHEESLSSGPHMSHPLLLSHLPCTTSTSSSSFTLPATTTPEHSLQSGQHDLLQEYSVHHQPLQALPVEKQRYQEPLWRESRQSDGNLRNTSSTGFEPKELATKELATVSRISGITDPYQIYDAQKEFGEQDHQAPITKELEEFGDIGTHTLPDYLETSHFQSHVHFDDSVESIADYDLEDGELQKMLASPLCMPRKLR